MGRDAFQFRVNLPLEKVKLVELCTNRKTAEELQNSGMLENKSTNEVNKMNKICNCKM